MRSGLCWLTISQERRARALFSSDIDSLCSFLSRFPRRVVAPQSCIVEPSEAEHMSQMHYFCLLEGMLGPREPESSLPLYSPSCREGSFSETHIHTLACLCGIGAYASGLVHQACSPGFLVGLFSEAGWTAQFLHQLLLSGRGP